MRKRDALIILVACISVLVSLQNEGSFSFRKAWYHLPSTDAQDFLVEHHTLPPPLVADLNGDGQLELVVATSDLKIQVVRPQVAGRQGEGFAAANTINEVSLLYKRVTIMAGRRPVAMTVGYLDPVPKERVRPPRKQVVVVVTASWQVLCFDHNLKLMWEYDVRSSFPHHSHIKEVAVFVAPHQVEAGDRGLVVVGASLARGDLLGGEGLEGDLRGDAHERAFSDDDVIRAEMRLEEEEQAHARSAARDAPLSDLDAGDPAKGLDTSRHFDYIGLEGGTGTKRWSHTSTDFHKDLDALADKTKPLDEYRLDAEKLDGRHFGEASCRDYRQSVLHVLPHAWSSPLDTRLEEAHFIRRREGRGAQRERLASKDKGAHTGQWSQPRRQPAPGNKPSFLGLGAPHAVQQKSKSRQSGREHHVSGHHGSSTAGAHAAANSHWEHHHNFTANSLVAFLEEGIEVVHLFSGRTVCKLHLPPGTLHADINGDGVLDHVQVFHGSSAVDGDVESDDNSHHPRSHCTAVAMSGMPPRERLFEVNVCRTRSFLGAGGNVLSRLSGTADQALELATPVFLPLPQLGGYRSTRSLHGLVLFASSHGEVTAVNALGDHVWSGSYPVGWPHSALVAGGAQRVVPTLAPLALRRHAVPTAALVAGASAAVVLSEHGNILAQLSLPHPPNQPLLVADFNGDGLNDLVAITPQGIYGYQQVAHVSGSTLSALLGTLIVAMAIVWYTQLYEGGATSQATSQAKRQRKLRSTEYVD